MDGRRNDISAQSSLTLCSGNASGNKRLCLLFWVRDRRGVAAAGHLPYDRFAKGRTTGVKPVTEHSGVRFEAAASALYFLSLWHTHLLLLRGKQEDLRRLLRAHLFLFSTMLLFA